MAFKYYCDRCGKLIEPHWWKGKPQNVDFIFDGYELCWDCYGSFKRWFLSKEA